jgi:15-cis-phytoene synthase
MTRLDVAAAYRGCEAITRARARNFYYGIRLLPAPKRAALCAVYAYARRIDDIGDDGGEPAEEKLRRLAGARDELASLTRPDPGSAMAAAAAGSDPVLLALADAAARFPLPLAAFGELIDGVELDVRGTSYATFAELLHYCRCVAGSIGRLSLGVFGARGHDGEAGAPAPAAAQAQADALGVAMQLTNILRDVLEDRAMQRAYLPAEDLARFGCDATLAPRQAFAELVRFEAARAERWFATGLELLPLLDRRSAACVAAMSGIYRRLLARIMRAPETVLDRRVQLPRWEKAAVAARSLAGMPV